MKTISFSPYVPGEDRVATTDCGEFTVEQTYRGYSEHHYSVTKVSGEWPSKEALGLWLDNRFDYFGGEVIINDNHAFVRCYVD